MNNFIPVKILNISQSIEAFFCYLKSIKSHRKDMIFFSKNCYTFIKENFTFLGEVFEPYGAKNFLHYAPNTNTRVYFSLMPMYNGEWFYLESLSFGKVNHSKKPNIPKEIVFVTLDNEFPKSTINVEILETPFTENPVNCIMKDSKKFENSILFLTEDAFLTLGRTTNLVSKHKCFYRLEWYSDESYPGGLITLKMFNNGSSYLIENMQFPFFNKAFSINGLPNSVFFIS